MNLFAPALPQIPDHFGRATVRANPKSKAIHEGNGALASFDYVLNAYRGCSFGCSYCYAAFFVSDFKQRADWGNWVEVKTGVLDEVEAAWFLKGKRLYMSSATDPYQPLEIKLGLTRSILELLAEEQRQPRLVIQTRSPLVTRDIDLLRHFEDVRVNMSITTDSEEVRKQFEPGCASIPRRLEAVKMLTDAGIKTRVCVSPMLPIEDVPSFAQALLETGADQVVTSPFHATGREFAANTGERALQIAHAIGWKREKYLKTVAHLRRHLPTLRSWVDADEEWQASARRVS
jgi:DNA repair photolyase